MTKYLVSAMAMVAIFIAPTVSTALTPESTVVMGSVGAGGVFGS